MPDDNFTDAVGDSLDDAWSELLVLIALRTAGGQEDWDNRVAERVAAALGYSDGALNSFPGEGQHGRAVYEVLSRLERMTKVRLEKASALRRAVSRHTSDQRCRLTPQGKTARLGTVSASESPRDAAWLVTIVLRMCPRETRSNLYALVEHSLGRDEVDAMYDPPHQHRFDETLRHLTNRGIAKENLFGRLSLESQWATSGVYRLRVDIEREWESDPDHWVPQLVGAPGTKRAADGLATPPKPWFDIRDIEQRIVECLQQADRSSSVQEIADAVWPLMDLPDEQRAYKNDPMHSKSLFDFLTQDAAIRYLADALLVEKRDSTWRLTERGQHVPLDWVPERCLQAKRHRDDYGRPMSDAEWRAWEKRQEKGLDGQTRYGATHSSYAPVREGIPRVEPDPKTRRSTTPTPPTQSSHRSAPAVHEQEPRSSDRTNGGRVAAVASPSRMFTAPTPAHPRAPTGAVYVKRLRRVDREEHRRAIRKVLTDRQGEWLQDDAIEYESSRALGIPDAERRWKDPDHESKPWTLIQHFVIVNLSDLQVGGTVGKRTGGTSRHPQGGSWRVLQEERSAERDDHGLRRASFMQQCAEFAKVRHTLLDIEDVTADDLGRVGIHLVGWRDVAGDADNSNIQGFAYRVAEDLESLGDEVGQEIRDVLPQARSWLQSKLQSEYPSVKGYAMTGHLLSWPELTETARSERTGVWNPAGAPPIGLHRVVRGASSTPPTEAPPKSSPAASTPAGVNTTQTAASTGGDTIDKQAGLQRYPADPAERWHEALLQIISDELPSAETHGMGFELLCAELLESHDDVKSLERVGGVGDGGLDVFAELKHGGRRYVQCKHHASRPVNDREVSSFLGKVDNRVGHGAHVEASYYTTSRYTAHAISEADQKRRKFPVELVDGDGLCTQLFSSRLGCKEHFADGQRWVVLDRNYFRELRGKLVSR